MLNKTPANLLSEIIMVDDFSNNRKCMPSFFIDWHAMVCELLQPEQDFNKI